MLAMIDDGYSTTGDAQDQTQRIDKWLWFSRVLKSRTSAAQLISDGKVRVNLARVIKPSLAVRRGDVLTIALRGKVHVLKVVAAGQRRGPPAEARLLYEIIESPPADGASAPASGSGRPAKRDRRMINRLMGQK
jgi:ribosome-associated heat shock protein Hsp15